MTEITQQKTNPLLSRLQIPGETFRLPSQGLFYSNGELSDDVVNGEVHVYPMTAYDEIIFKTPDMLLSGKAVDEVFSRCIPQVLKPRRLLSKDIDYLITCLRVITYGPDITLTYKHDCENGKEREYTTSLASILRQAKSIDPTSLNTVFKMEMPNGQLVKLKPTTFDAVLELSQNLGGDTDDETLIAIQNKILHVICNMIDSVDGISDSEMINEWVSKLPAGWVRQLSETIDKISDWGVEFKAKTVCKDCGQEIEMPFSANPVSFFS
jgi:hypothetical protein